MHGFKVAYSDKVGEGYGGLNCYAAKELHLPFKHRCDTVEILRDQTCRDIKDTIWHEAIESILMKELKLPYRKAHRLTQKIEKNR